MSIFDTLKKVAPSATDGTPTPLSTAPQTFVFQALPESVDEMKNLDESTLDSPFKTAALTVCALCAYAAAPEIGIEMLNFLKGPQPLNPREIQFLKDRFRDGGVHVPFSYFAGAVPANNYTPDEPFSVTIFTNSYSYETAGYARLLITSGGADSPRYVKLRQKGDQWFLWEQFLTAGIRKPASEDPWS